MDSKSLLKSPQNFFKRVEESYKDNDPLRKEKAPQGYLAEPNTTQTPNFFFDFLMVGMDECQIKVVLYMIRHTYGYGKKGGDFITEEQFINGTVNNKTQKRVDWGCGITKEGEKITATKARLRRTMRSLEDLGIVETVRNMKIKVYDKFNTNFYRLKIKEEEVNVSE